MPLTEAVVVLDDYPLVYSAHALVTPVGVVIEVALTDILDYSEKAEIVKRYVPDGASLLGITETAFHGGEVSEFSVRYLCPADYQPPHEGEPVPRDGVLV